MLPKRGLLLLPPPTFDPKVMFIFGFPKIDEPLIYYYKTYKIKLVMAK